MLLKDYILKIFEKFQLKKTILINSVKKRVTTDLYVSSYHTYVFFCDLIISKTWIKKVCKVYKVCIGDVIKENV